MEKVKKIINSISWVIVALEELEKSMSKPITKTAVSRTKKESEAQ